MPEPAQYEGRHEVQVNPGRGATIAAERNIEVIAQVAAERNVPPSPEILDIQCLVRRIEIDGQPDVEQQCRPDRHVTVTAEIEIKLKGVGEAGPQALKKSSAVSPSNPAFAQIAKVSAMTTFLNKPMLKIVDRRAVDLGDLLDAVLDGGEHPEAEQVDLEKAGVGTGVLVPLAELATRAIAAGCTGTRSISGRDEITMPPGCWEMWRGRPAISSRQELEGAPALRDQLTLGIR